LSQLGCKFGVSPFQNASYECFGILLIYSQ
jgi:hypothetical protein